MTDAADTELRAPLLFSALERASPATRRAVRIAAENWLEGSLALTLPNGRKVAIEGARPGPRAEMVIRRDRAFARILGSADIGLAEGYLEGDWDTPDLAALLTALSLNFDRLQHLVEGSAVMRMVHFFGHLLNRNSRKGSRRNILAHYDLGNAFYEAWLDPSMTYSSALFSGGTESLADAQRAKYARLARDMDLKPGMSVVEIGCGWGGFAEYAAREIGAKVVGLTLSDEQAKFARARMHRLGLSDQVEIRIQDYRDLEGQFDRVASIEMFEAVGEEYWGGYFDTLRRVLKSGGRAGLQIITIRDDLFEHYRSRADFIQKYIFPGGMLPSRTRLEAGLKGAGLSVDGVLHFGADYARTLQQWRNGFQNGWSSVETLGFDERFRRLWLFYLSYCEAGFRTGRTDVVQVQATRV
jgi:cyclopropane-fatty-acyl-phospholipid synthase